MSTTSPTRIVMVDDNPIDVESVRRGLRRCFTDYDFLALPDAASALAHMRREPLDRSTILLLDIQLPDMSGLDLLASLEERASLCRAPVFIFTTSSNDHDVDKAYSLGIAGYITKRGAGPAYRRLVEFLDEYLEVVRLPRAPLV